MHVKSWRINIFKPLEVAESVSKFVTSAEFLNTDKNSDTGTVLGELL